MVGTVRSPAPATCSIVSSVVMNALSSSASPGTGFPLHQDLLPLLGIPIGEYWVLDRLAGECARDRSYAFMLVSVPLNLRGAIGSPPQAVAVR